MVSVYEIVGAGKCPDEEPVFKNNNVGTQVSHLRMMIVI